MNIEMNGKKILEIWFPEDKDGYTQHICSDEARSLRLSATHHGEYDMFWVVEEIDGIEEVRHNCKYIEGILWLNE